MIVEQRTYTTLPGRVPDYLRLYEAEGMAPQLRILGRMVGYYRAEIGTLNQIVHMWAYDSLEDRSEKRARLAADPAFAAYVKKIFPLLVSQESRILTPASFFQPRWQGVEVLGEH